MNPHDYSYVDAVDFLTALGVKNISVSSGEVNFSCPLAGHTHGDHRPSARMNVESCLWMCHKCGERGTPTTFLVLLRGVNETVAKRVIEERYGGSLSAPIDDMVSEVERIMASPIPDSETRRAPGKEWLERFYVPWMDPSILARPWAKYMLEERGLDPRVLETWKIGYDQISDRVSIPVFDEHSNLVGFKGRSYNGRHPRYMILGDGPNRTPRYGFDTYRKSEHVFGLNRIGPGCSQIIVTEGEINTIAMYQKGWSNAVGVAGSEFSETQARLIAASCPTAIVFFDADDAGMKGTEKVITALEPYVSVYVVDDAPGDAAELTAEQILTTLATLQPSTLRRAKMLLSVDTMPPGVSE